eukprot:353125-Chlamydomonas_euryale.AAC.10
MWQIDGLWGASPGACGRLMGGGLHPGFKTLPLCCGSSWHGRTSATQFLWWTAVPAPPSPLKAPRRPGCQCLAAWTRTSAACRRCLRPAARRAPSASRPHAQRASRSCGGVGWSREVWKVRKVWWRFDLIGTPSASPPRAQRASRSRGGVGCS